MSRAIGKNNLPSSKNNGKCIYIVKKASIFGIISVKVFPVKKEVVPILLVLVVFTSMSRMQ